MVNFGTLSIYAYPDICASVNFYFKKKNFNGMNLKTMELILYLCSEQYEQGYEEYENKDECRHVVPSVSHIRLNARTEDMI